MGIEWVAGVMRVPQGAFTPRGWAPGKLGGGQVPPTILGSSLMAARGVRSAAQSPHQAWPQADHRQTSPSFQPWFLTSRPCLVPVRGFLQRRNANTSTNHRSCWAFLLSPKRIGIKASPMILGTWVSASG